MMIKTQRRAPLSLLAGVALTLMTLALALELAAQPVEPAKAAAADAQALVQSYQTEMDYRLDQIAYGEDAPKQYWISDTAQAAPEPDQSRYGQAQSAAELQWLIDEAQTLLDGQELYFSADTPLLEESTVHYYLDETILAITWKQLIDHVVFTFSEVKLLHPSQFRRYLSGGEFGSGILSTTTDMSQSVNAVVACSGDYYAYRRKGVTVTNGTVHKAVAGVSDACYVDYNGDLILERGLKFADQDEAQAYMDQHNVHFSLSFGPILVKDGEYCCPSGYSLGEVHNGFPRAAICQMGTLHYLFAVTNMEVHHYQNLTMKEFAQCLYETGCRHAYALDGGQTATVVMNDQLINNVNYGSQRLISDIIYFATAKPAKE